MRDIRIWSLEKKKPVEKIDRRSMKEKYEEFQADLGSLSVAEMAEKHGITQVMVKRIVKSGLYQVAMGQVDGNKVRVSMKDVG